MPNGCVPRKKKKKNKFADYKAEEEQCSRRGLKGGGSFSRGAIGSPGRGREREEGQERDKMATYEHLQQRAPLQVLNYLGGVGRFSLEDVSADR